MADVTLIKGDATERWPLEDNALDSIVTDPPYGIAFMGKSWDDKGGPAAYQEWSASWAREAFRCLKPGGFLLAFGATRMAHRMTCGFEDAGFEILDGIEWLYLSGMPKAQDIGKLFDKKNGSALAFAEEAERFGAYLKDRRVAMALSRTEIDAALGLNTSYSWWEGRKSGVQPPSKANYLRLKPILEMDDRFDDFIERVEAVREKVGEVTKARSADSAFAMPTMGADTEYQTWDITAPASDLARQWDGWKTPSLKPAHEPIVVARKPFTGTYCENLEQWGVGAINVGGCRVPIDPEERKVIDNRSGADDGKRDGKYNDGMGFRPPGEKFKSHEAGRFPANVVMSHGPDCTPEACQDGCPVKILDGQSGMSKSSGGFTAGSTGAFGKHGRYGKANGDIPDRDGTGYGDTGGGSKVFAKFFYEAADFAPFFYCPKASGKERHEGLEHPGAQFEHGATMRHIENGLQQKGNFHPTVKPLNLVRYLQRLVTPRGGLTGSPFLGSGTDAVSAIHEGFAFWGMNLPDRPGEEYWPIIEARVAHAIKVEGEPQEPIEPTTQTAPPAETGQVRFSFEGTANP